MQISTKIITSLQNIWNSTNTTKLGVPADIVHSSPTNVEHKQYFDTRSC